MHIHRHTYTNTHECVYIGTCTQTYKYTHIYKHTQWPVPQMIKNVVISFNNDNTIL